MTVAELILELQKYPPDSVVMRESHYNGEIRYVEVKQPHSYVAELKKRGNEYTALRLHSSRPFPQSGFVVLKRE